MLIQQEIQNKVEAPMISDLTAGSGGFEGPQGYQSYFDHLLPHRSAYEPISRQLHEDWKAKRDNLLRVRDVAAKKLWPMLHNEWLPRLEDDTDFAKHFAKLIKRALTADAFARHLDSKPTRIIVGGIGGIVLATATGSAVKFMTEQVGLPSDPTVEIVKVLIAGLAGTGIAERYHDHAESIKNLAIFYQEAQRTIGSDA
jgi:hypothetical protein